MNSEILAAADADVIDQAHQRSQGYGISVNGEPDYSSLAQGQLRDVLEEMSARHGFEGYKTYVQKHGRARFIEIHIVLPAGYPLTSVKTLDALREEISGLLGAADSARWLTISFTGDRKWIS